MVWLFRRSITPAINAHGSSGKRLSPKYAIAQLLFFTLLTSPLAVLAQDKTILIDPDDDSCKPADPQFASCAAACEINPLGCATDIQNHISSDAFQARRQLYPTTGENDRNPTTPMHGLFNTIYVNQRAKIGIEGAIAEPFDAVDLPAWSIVVKSNGNPVDASGKLERWDTPMYKIPGYCPDRAVAAADGPCVGGEWFWYLYRFDKFHVFDYDPIYGGLPAYGKADAFCLECHGAVAEADWLWLTHFRRERARQVAEPLRFDNKTPGRRGAEFCDDVTELSPRLPRDVRFDPVTITPDSKRQRMFDCFAWKAFVALNWPANPFWRGQPARFLPFNTPQQNRVWETYAQVYEAFQPQDPNWSLSTQHWNQRQPLPEVCVQALNATPAHAFPTRARTFQLLNERNQAYGNQFNTLTDSNGNELRYNVRLNPTEWLYLKLNGFADTGTYDYQGPIGKTVDFPDNRSPYGRHGAIEIKSAWKELCTDSKTCDPVDDVGRYYARNAFIYDQAVEKSEGVEPERCRIAQVGLVGLHAVFKTFWQPQWIWATFEQIDNVPDYDADTSSADGAYTLFDPQCLANPPTQEECLFQRPGVMSTSAPLTCCQNLQMIPNSPSAPDSGFALANVLPAANSIPIANQVTRIDPIGESAQELNQIFQDLLGKEGSAFQYYQLINTQWAGNGRQGADTDHPFAINQKLCLEGDEPPCYTLMPRDLRLRNTTMETFQVSYCHPDDENIDNDPQECSPGSVVHDPTQASSAGCMNCHLASGTDASFIWEDAIWERVPIVSETRRGEH